MISTTFDRSDVDLNAIKDDNYSVSIGYQSLDDGDSTNNIHNDDMVELDAVLNDRLININFIILLRMMKSVL